MEAKIDSAIECLLAEIKTAMSANDALKFTQAALNLANVKQTQQKG